MRRRRQPHERLVRSNSGHDDVFEHLDLPSDRRLGHVQPRRRPAKMKRSSTSSRCERGEEPEFGRAADAAEMTQPPLTADPVLKHIIDAPLLERTSPGAADAPAAVSCQARRILKLAKARRGRRRIAMGKKDRSDRLHGAAAYASCPN